MKKILSTLLCLFLAPYLFAQDLATAIAQFESATAAKVSLEEATQTVQFIRFPHNAPLSLPGNTLPQKVTAFLSTTANNLFPKGNEWLQFKESKVDAYGFHHLIYEGIYQGVPIFGNELRFHFNADQKLTAVNGLLFSSITLNTTPVLTPEEAGFLALDEMEKQTGGDYSAPLEIHSSTLFVFKDKVLQNKDGRMHLVYEVEIRNEAEVREFLFIDAHTGKLVEQFAGHCDALFRRLYNGSIANQIWQEGNAFPGSLTAAEQTVLEAAGHTYYLFENTFNYTSYNDLDAEMRSVNNITSGCPNAFWNGSTTNYCSGVNSDDVVGHEWGHAYTEYTSSLIYQWQAGALNESYSDIWGETIDLLNAYNDAGEDLSLRTACASSQRWRMGEDATAFSGPIRDMWDPTCNGDPGKVTDAQYHCSTSDNGGVHTNSGVNNHGYALLVDGGTYNGYTITSLGFTKAAHIFWRAQSFYLTSTSDFFNQADALEASCTDLLGINLEGLSFSNTPAGPSGQIITPADCLEVSDMVDAVEFRTEPDCDFIPLLQQPAQALCPADNNPEIIFEDNFESGLDGWTITQHPQNPDDWESREWIIDSTLPKARAGSAAFGPDPINGNCGSDLENGIIRIQSPVIAIPSAVVSPMQMAFEHYIATEPGWDGGNIKYSLNGGSWTLVPSAAFDFNPYNSTIIGGGNDNPMAAQAAFTGTDGGSLSGSWGQSIIDLDGLGAVAGTNIQFRFEMGTDGCNGNDGWYIDDLEVYHCVSALPVELLLFTARADGMSVLLNWATASEINSKGFFVEKSKDGHSWESMGFVASAGEHTVSRVDYTFSDEHPWKGMNYYRLKQIDLDGVFEYSEIRSVKMDFAQTDLVRFQPNPFTNSTTMILPTTTSGKVTISIYDITGRQLWSEERTVTDESNLLLEDPGQLPKGIYAVKVSTLSEVYTGKLIRE
jgi:bacillolysin